MNPLMWLDEVIAQLRAQGYADWPTILEREVRPVLASCEYCVEGLPRDAQNRHRRDDPEGVEGAWVIPCLLPG